MDFDELRKALRTAAGTVIVPVLDKIEQSNRDKSRPPTEAEKAWDDAVRLHKSGAPAEKVQEQFDRYENLQYSPTPTKKFPSIQGDLVPNPNAAPLPPPLIGVRN